jgi:two-component sensor histidine kinase
MSALGDLLHSSTQLGEGAIDHLQALVGEWSLLSDLSFADLLLLVAPATQRAGEEFLVVAQVRPATGPTAYQNDLVGRLFTAAQRPAVATAWTERRIVREGDPEWSSGVPVREEAIPVRYDGDVVAVLARDTNLATARSPSPLELAYLRSSSDLAQMVAEGSFPFPIGRHELVDAPRVGDGVMRLNAVGEVVYASPNALSAYRRIGYTGNVTGEYLQSVHAILRQAADRAADRPPDRTPERSRIWDAVVTGGPVEEELAAAGAVVTLRAIPLLPGGRVAGALLLVRDVTELRRREEQLLTKDATIREIHHRVKNNLQTVAALLRLQARRTAPPEAREALLESVRRVTSIALVHETLSQTLDESVAFDSIADELVSMTVDVAATGPRPAIRRTGDFGVLPGRVATPLALVLSELLQNSVEHAFDGGNRDGVDGAAAIEVRVRRDERGLQVIVADNGAGLPADFAPERSQRLGLQIVRSLVVGELRGTFVLRPAGDRGTEAVVAVPAEAL